MRVRCNRIFFFFVIQVLLVSDIFAGDLHYYLDYATFNANHDFRYIELYFGFRQNSLQHEAVNDKYQANIQLTVEVFLNDSLISSQSWQNKSEVDSLSVLRRSQILNDMYGIYLKEGRYRFVTRLADLNLNLESEKSFDIQVAAQSKKLSLSDIQLASLITRDNSKSNFVKNGFKVLPNPQGMYSPLKPVLYYYFEIYNLSDLMGSVDSTYAVNMRIENPKGEVIQQLPSKSKLRNAGSLVELGQTYLAGFSDGLYNLQVEVIDHAKQDTTRAAKAFYFFAGTAMDGVLK